MATQSIMNNIIIHEPKAAEIFVNAMEKAAEAAKTSVLPKVEYENVQGDEIEKVIGALIK